MATSSQLPAAARIAARRVQRRLRRLRRRALSVAVITCAVAGALGSAARVDAAQHHGRRHAMRSASSAPALAFGIYPGGGAGSVDAAGPMHPEDPAQRLSALQQLRPARRPFVLRLYASYTGGSGSSAEAQVGQDLAQYTARGFRLEVVLCYRPSGGKRSLDVPGFVEFVQAAVEQLGPNHGVVALQVTNEANVSGAPNAADGYYAGASDTLIAGVEAAKATIAHDGFGQLKVGFSWAYQLDSAEKSFWSYLGQRGGVAFRRALDWVGIDAYPGTWGPPLSANIDLASAVRRATVNALSSLRNTYMPLAGIPGSTPIHVSESGAPTGAVRSEQQQSITLQAAVRAVSDYRASYAVTDYRWFDLRDANSSSPSFEDHYGLMTDTYTAKPAFSAYHTLVSNL